MDCYGFSSSTCPRFTMSEGRAATDGIWATSTWRQGSPFGQLEGKWTPVAAIDRSGQDRIG